MGKSLRGPMEKEAQPLSGLGSSVFARNCEVLIVPQTPELAPKGLQSWLRARGGSGLQEAQAGCFSSQRTPEGTTGWQVGPRVRSASALLRTLWFDWHQVKTQMMGPLP